MRKLPLSRRSLLTATALGAVTAAAGSGPALATPRGRRTGLIGATRTTATAADVTAVPLGDLNGLHMWQPAVVNRNGDVIGASTVLDPASVVWSRGELHTPALPATGTAHLEDINDQGQFVGGFRRSADYKQFAIVWPEGVNGEAVLIEPGDDFRDSVAYFVNNNGQVFYTAVDTGSDAQRAFVYDLSDGSRTEVQAPSGYPEGVGPRGFNATAQAVAVSDDLAFFWEGSVATPLVAAGLRTIRHLNEAGQVLAEYRGSLGRRAYVWQDGVFTDIPTPSEFDIYLSSTRQPMNDHGDVIGLNETADGVVPFLYSGGRTTQLPTDAGSAAEPLGLNNDGLIVGRHSPEGVADNHACLWQDGAFLDLGTVQGYSHTEGLLATEQGGVLAVAFNHANDNCAYLLTVN